MNYVLVKTFNVKLDAPFFMLLLVFEYEQVDSSPVINKGQLRRKTGKRIRSDIVEIGSPHLKNRKKGKKKDGFRVQWKGPATSH